jgi:hypothetical protein
LPKEARDVALNLRRPSILHIIIRQLIPLEVMILRLTIFDVTLLKIIRNIIIGTVIILTIISINTFISIIAGSDSLPCRHLQQKKG